jgi:hypothetical protein
MKLLFYTSKLIKNRFAGNTNKSYICTTLNGNGNKAKSLKVDSVAQLVEHNTFNVGVLGSNPSGITRE